MSELIQAVKDGVIAQTKTTTQKTSGNELGKDAFLQLLTTQMKYQDPLQPNTDTQFISQLATFSQLEQMQNLSSVTSNSQAFNLVGKNVIVKATTDTKGNASLISGKVDFVNMANGKAQLSINGSLYSIDQLDSVIDDNYIVEKGRPSINKKINLSYDGSNPQNTTFDVNLGSGDYKADNVAIFLNGTTQIDSSKITVSGNKVTIDKSAFTGLENGVYKLAAIFNDSLYTTVKDMISLQVSNAAEDGTSSDQSADNTAGGTTNTADYSTGSESNQTATA